MKSPLKDATRVALALAFVLIAGLVLRHDLRGGMALLEGAGLPLLMLVPFHALPLWLDSISWRVLLRRQDPERRAGLRFLWVAASVREAVSRLLPLSGIGGEIVGVRLLILRGIASTVAVANVLTQLLVSVVTQGLFAMIGLGLLARTGALPGATARGIAAALAAMPILVAASVAGLQRGRPFSVIQRRLHRLARGQLAARVGIDVARLDAELAQGLGAAPQLRWACVWELTGLLVGALENGLALLILGHPVSITVAVELESALQVVRRLFFVVPGGLGAQELGLTGVGALIGLPADGAIALSLTKRMREIAFGFPALLWWQWLEVRQTRIKQRD